jgi:transposase
MRATKSVSQLHRSEVSKGLLQSCLTLTYNAMEYGEDNHTDDRRGMKEFYRSLKGVDIPSCYKVAIVTRACAILKSREKVVQIGVSRIVKISQMTREIVASFKRDDVRIRRQISSKYWKRSDHRTDQMLHAATNYIVESAVKDHAALAVEELTGINRMCRRGNGQGADYRFRMNSWPHWKAWNMLQYRSAWKSVTVVQLTRSETRGSSTTHTCGERLRNPARDDVGHRRMLWCAKCKVWVDRDVNAAMVLSERGLARLASSLPRSRARKLLAGEKGPAGEA